MKKRWIALLLAVLMLASCLAGCSKGGKTPGAENTDKPGTVVVPTSADKTAVSAKYAYKAEYIDMPAEFNWINNATMRGSTLFFNADIVDGQETYTDEETGEEVSYDNYRSGLFSMNVETGEYHEIENLPEPAIPEGWEGSTGINNMQAADDGTLWVLYNCYTYRYNTPEDFDPETEYEWDYYEEGENTSSLLHISADGELLSQLDIQPEADEDGYVNSIYNFQVDADNNVYASDWQNLYVFDKDGKQIAKLDCSEYGGEPMKFSADQVGLSVYEYDETTETSGQYFQPVDVTTGDWGERMQLPSNAWNFFPGDDVYDLYYEDNGKIYGWKMDGDIREKVVDWMECDIDSNSLSNYEILPDGRVVALLRNETPFVDTVYNSAVAVPASVENSNNMQLVILTRVDASTLPEKTLLSVACFYLDWNMRSKIIDFNKNSDKYRIVVTDYSEFSTDEDYTAGILKLNTEILSGKVPDILMTSNLPMERYAAKGVFTDLYELIDADGELTRDSFVPEVLKACETDGKLYQIPTSFYIDTCFGLEKVVGEYETWNMDAVKDAMTKLQPDADIFNYYADRQTAIYYLISRNLGAFVDWNNQTCHFDSPEFASILELVKEFPESFDWEAYDEEGVYEEDTSRIKNGKQLLQPVSLSSIDSYTYQCAGCGDIKFVGYPSEDGTTASSFSVNNGMAISTACADKEGAWSFVRSMLTEQYQGNESMVWAMPINQAVFDAKLERAMTIEYYTDENGEQVDWDEDGQPDMMEKGGYWEINPETGEEEYKPIYALEQAEVDMILDVLHSTTRISTTDDSILAVVTDEAAAFFADQKSAADTAKMIQDRCDLYIKEQS